MDSCPFPRWRCLNHRFTLEIILFVYKDQAQKQLPDPLNKKESLVLLFGGLYAFSD